MCQLSLLYPTGDVYKHKIHKIFQDSHNFAHVDLLDLAVLICHRVGHDGKIGRVYWEFCVTEEST